MSNPWFRMYSEFSHDPKVQMLSEAMQRRYIMIMCMRCGNGLVTLHETEIAFHLRITDQELAETKALFISKGFIDSGWNLLNWEKRQMLSDTSNARVAKHRALSKAKQETACNVTDLLLKQKCNALDTDTDTDIEVSKDTLSPESPATTLPTKIEPVPNCPHADLIDLFAQNLPSLPQPKVELWDGSRAEAMRQRWRWVLTAKRKTGERYAVDKPGALVFFGRFFAHVAKSDFLMGREGKWQCDLGWLMKAENFAKVIQGNYDGKAAA